MDQNVALHNSSCKHYNEYFDFEDLISNFSANLI